MPASMDPKIACPIVHSSKYVICAPDSPQRDAEKKISKTLAELEAASKPRHELAALRGFKKDVAGVELNHKLLPSGDDQKCP